MKVKTKWSTVSAVVSVEVVFQHGVHFIVRQVSWTRVHHGANVTLQNGQLKEVPSQEWALTNLNIERVHDHLPHAIE